MEGNEQAIASMLSAKPGDDLTEKLIDCMGVNSLSAEMLIANYCSQSMLANYSRVRLSKSDKGGVATLAERIAREWAKPTFAPLAAPGIKKRSATSEPEADDGAAKRQSALDEIKAKRAKKAVAGGTVPLTQVAGSIYGKLRGRIFMR